MTTEQCTEKHTYTITGRDGETLGTTHNGPKLAWALWTNAGPAALDLTATHPDGAVCLAETREARALLPGGPYPRRRDATLDTKPLSDAIHALDPDYPDDEDPDTLREAQRRAAADYVTGRLTHLGVELGAFDEKIAARVSEWEPESVAVILGWVQRARAAGRDSAMAERRVAQTRPAAPDLA